MNGLFFFQHPPGHRLKPSPSGLSPGDLEGAVMSSAAYPQLLAEVSHGTTKYGSQIPGAVARDPGCKTTGLL